MLRHTSRSSMGIDFADVDRDGHDDFIVVDMLAREHGKRMTQLVKDDPTLGPRERIEEQPSYNRNTLFFGRPDGSFAEAAFMAGVAATDWSWCPIFLDVDLDGYEDLLVSNGFSFDVMDQDSHDQVRHAKMTEEQLKRSRQLYPAGQAQTRLFAIGAMALSNRWLANGDSIRREFLTAWLWEIWTMTGIWMS